MTQVHCKPYTTLKLYNHSTLEKKKIVYGQPTGKFPECNLHDKFERLFRTGTTYHSFLAIHVEQVFRKV